MAYRAPQRDSAPDGRPGTEPAQDEDPAPLGWFAITSGTAHPQQGSLHESPLQKASMLPMLDPAPFESELDAARLTIHSVGDHSMQDGLAQLTAILDNARAASLESGARYDLVFDMTRSAEKKSPEELRAAGEFLAGWIDCLSGRVAVVSSDTVLFGMGRVFGSYAESKGLEVRVFRDAAGADEWFASGD